MNNILERKISAIFDKNPGNFTRLEISIECPLDSGVSVTGKWIGSAGNAYAQFGGAKDFFLYIEEYRKNNPNYVFNRVSMIANSDSRTMDVNFLFDEELQKRTEENMR